MSKPIDFAYFMKQRGVDRAGLAQALDVLRRARQRISDPTRWCKGANERSAKGRALMSLRPSPKACSWCASGAMNVAGYGVAIPCQFSHDYRGSDLAYALVYTAFDALDLEWNIVRYNDDKTTSHADILKMFDQVIEVWDAALATPEAA